jgi:hypothetical protein
LQRHIGNDIKEQDRPHLRKPQTSATDTCLLEALALEKILQKMERVDSLDLTVISPPRRVLLDPEKSPPTQVGHLLRGLICLMSQIALVQAPIAVELQTRAEDRLLR